jgi:ribosomal protein S18 acetylase RimI-like enzyme
MHVREARARDQAWIERVLVERWSSMLIVSHDVIHSAASIPALVAEVDDKRVGLLTYEQGDGQIEVVTLDALKESVGVGTALLVRLRELATAAGCHRIWLITTNDNLKALGFYQRFGFRLVALDVGAVDRGRVLKPSIPEMGRDGIALHDEIELSLQL